MGKKYVVNMINNFKGILVQEYDPVQECLVGEVKNVFPGTGRNYTEGPHIYHIGEYYYLLMAEGGTSYEHMATMARARSIWGPYEEDTGNPVLTSDVENPEELQKCGHARSCIALRMGGGTWCIYAQDHPKEPASASLAARPQFRKWYGTKRAGCDCLRRKGLANGRRKNRRELQNIFPGGRGEGLWER